MTNGEVDVAILVIQESYAQHMKEHTFLEDVRGYSSKTGFVKDIFTQKLNPDPQCYPEEYLRKAGHRTLELMERHPG